MKLDCIVSIGRNICGDGINKLVCRFGDETKAGSDRPSHCIKERKLRGKLNDYIVRSKEHTLNPESERKSSLNVDSFVFTNNRTHKNGLRGQLHCEYTVIDQVEVFVSGRKLEC